MPREKEYCIRCGKPNKKFGSRFCSTICSNAKYSVAEEEKLKKLSIFPAEIAIDKFKQFLSNNGLPQKTRKQISAKFSRMGIVFTCEETHLTQTGLATALGLDPARGKKFAKVGVPFRARKLKANTKKRVSKADLQDWLTWNQNKAKFFPYLEGCDLESLEFVVGSVLRSQYESWLAKGLVAELAGKPKKIMVNGVIYPSVIEASRKCYMGRYGLRLAADGVTKDSSLDVKWIEESA